SVVSEALVAAVRAVEEGALALVQVATVRSCGAPSPPRSAVTLGPLFYYLIRPQQQRRRGGEAQRLGGLEVDGQLQSHGLLNGEVLWAGSSDDLVDVGRPASRGLP